MTQALTKQVTFHEFIAWYPENPQLRYELHDGIIIEMTIGNPKQPTISVYQLVEGEYQVTQFRGGNYIQSPTFPELVLTAEQIFQVGISSLGEQD
ncbi:hypothetical protein SD80_022070 [Scytonema tolypothrichoides VB-61278]|nr:hypothetical protein SD80_022070 [Scytonema tolypothrichoides VB-61278]